jgi:hypothetical protein
MLCCDAGLIKLCVFRTTQLVVRHVLLLLQTRSADAGCRPMVLQTLDAIQSLGFTVVRIWAFNDGPGWMSLQPQAGAQCTPEAGLVSLYARLQQWVTGSGRSSRTSICLRLLLGKLTPCVKARRNASSPSADGCTAACVYVWAFNDGPGWISLQPQQCTAEAGLFQSA